MLDRVNLRSYLMSNQYDESDKAAQERDWKEHVARCHADGHCEFSGMNIVKCQRTICDCFETAEGAAEILKNATEKIAGPLPRLSVGDAMTTEEKNQPFPSNEYSVDEAASKKMGVDVFRKNADGLGKVLKKGKYPPFDKKDDDERGANRDLD